jgi:two-component system, NtrC family, sensor histidine kinase HydH
VRIWLSGGALQPAEGIIGAEPVTISPARFIRVEDIVWLALISALCFGPYRDPYSVSVLIVLGVFQIIETRIPWFSTQAGRAVATLSRLLLCYLEMALTGGINTSYYVILLLPIVSAASTMKPRGTIAFTLLSMLSYLSFFLFVDWSQYEFTDVGWGEIYLRVGFLPVVAFLTYQLAKETRIEASKHQAAAEQLAAANESLQKAEDEVRRSDRLAALGQLTAGLAHELRNPIGTIRASAEMLLKNVPDDKPLIGELAGFISTEVDRTNSLITRFLDFARPMHLKLEKTDLAELLDRAIAEFEKHNPPIDVTIYRNYAPEVPGVDLDGELMQRVFYNLILNAAQASPAGGSVSVKTRLVGDEVEVSVIDRGSGIAKEQLKNIFNPFFTTKPDGVGLGLAIVSKIVDEHRGTLAVESEAGGGSVFRVFLKVAE